MNASSFALVGYARARARSRVLTFTIPCSRHSYIHFVWREIDVQSYTRLAGILSLSLLSIDICTMQNARRCVLHLLFVFLLRWKSTGAIVQIIVNGKCNTNEFSALITNVTVTLKTTTMILHGYELEHVWMATKHKEKRKIKNDMNSAFN